MAENHRFLSFQAKAEEALKDAVKLLNLNQEAEELLLKKKKGEDVFDYLGAIFSFQADNVRNQRDHVVHLLTNTQSILSGEKSLSADDILKEAIDQVAEKTLENYDLWYNHSIKWLKTSRYFKRERLLLSCLYLLIWGEAANLRFMPECLCFIFHHMVADLWMRPLMKSESFLRSVIKPIHVLLISERKRLSHTTSHTRWSNYDDFNELFWSSECLELFEWENKKFKLSDKVAESPKRGSKWSWTRKSYSKAPEATPIQRDAENKWKNFVRYHSRKTNFLERRTFLHIFHTFHRLWIFLIIMLQGMIVVAFYGKLSVKNLLSLGPSHAVMMTFQSVLDLVFSYDPLRFRRFFVKSETSGHDDTKRHRGTHKFRMLAQLTFYAVWTGILTFLYVKVLLQPEDVVNEYYEIMKIVLAAYAGAHLAHGAGYTILSFFSSENKFVAGVKWLFKEQQFVGHNMRVKASYTLTYGAFWLILFALKFLVSYKFQIQPLVKPTKYIWRMSGVTYVWHDLVSEHNHNFLTIASIWTPLILIYFLDVQIWYIVIAALYGCISGGNAHLGEIRSLVTFVDVFHKLPGKFAGRLVHDFPSSAKDERRLAQAKVFAPYWNQIVAKLRDEDYLNNEEKELLLMSDPQNLDVIQWPLFIVINRVQLGLSMLKLNKEKQLFRKLHSDRYMRHAVRDIYCCIEVVLDKLVGLKVIWDMIPVHRQGKLSDLRAEFLKTNKFWKSFKDRSKVKDLTELVCVLVKILHDTPEKNTIESALRALIKHFLDSFVTESIFNHEAFPGLDVGKLENTEEIIGRLYKLLYSEDSALDVPTNDEARRRLLFFGNSLGMKIPEAPAIEEMLSFSVLTPHYDEVVLYSLEYLASRNKDGITNLYYLQLVYSDEWKFFLQRTGIKDDEIAILAQIGEKDATEEDYPLRKMLMEDLVKRKFFEELKKRKAFQGITDRTLIVDHALKCLRLWASYRGQTLARTVRGMMHYHDALRFQHRRDKQTETSEFECRFVANMKFTYVVTCQEYSEARKSGKAIAKDIEYLLNMQKNPALAVAYVEKSKDGDDEKYESRLRMWEDDRVKDKYSIELPGNFLIGEGKPENQNHAIIFTRGDALQTIDMNQDNYFEEALKMRNLLEEFKLRKYFKEDSKSRNDPEKLKLKRKKRIRRTILGVREHVFTGSVSSLAWFMSNQETSFVTLGQRVMANPLRVRMHYGHPDVFDRIFHITRGGVSKASKTINLSEDIFAGFNTTLRGGSVTHHEYIQVGKGRDLGLNQISAFEAKISSGNGEQMISRDVYRLGRYFDFGRMLSFYYTSVGYYVSTMLVLWALYAYLYGKIYLALSGVEDDMLKIKDTEQNEALQGALTTQFLFQIGFFNCIPMIMGYILEQGFLKAAQYFVLMSLLGSSIFFSFSLATRSHYFGRTLLHGGATYRKTGRGFVIEHIQFAENFRFYSRSHFIKGLEIGMLLVLYAVYGSQRKTDYVLFSVSNWFLALCWLYAPFVFNPLGFEWQKSVEDISNWNKWLVNRNAGAKDVDSWTTWWEKQTEFHGNRARIFEIILSLRFFVVQYGVVYHLTENRGNNRLLVYGISWVLFVGVAAMLAFISVSTTSGNKLRLAHSVVFVVLFGSFTAGSITVLRFEVLDVLASVLALIPTGWGLLCVAVACKPLLQWGKVWWMVSTWAWCYDAAMGYFIFGPVIFLSWFPFISPLHTRILYNQAFSRGLEISVLLSGNRP